MTRQYVCIFGTCGGRGCARGDAAERLARYLEEHRSDRVVAMTGNEDKLIVVFEAKIDVPARSTP